MKSMSLKLKLIFLLIGIGVIPLIIYGISYTTLTRSTLLQYEFQKLEAVNEVKKETLEQYFSGLEAQLNVISDNFATLSSFDTINTFYKEKTEAGQSFDTSSAEYKEFWEELYADMRHFRDEFGYYDIFLIRSGDGTVLYSDTKEGDLGEVLSTGKLKDSGLGIAWKLADTTGKLAVTDLAPYAPSNGDPASFMAQPIMRNGKKLGVVAIQVPTQLISKITKIRAGLGETSESYLVGPDNFMRSDSYLDPDNFSSLNSFKKGNKVDTEGVRLAISGEHGQKIFLDYRGVPVLSAYTPFKLPNTDITWALLTEVDEEEALRISNTFRNYTILGIFVFAGIVLFIGVLVGRALSTPIATFSNILSGSIQEVSNEASNVSKSSINISHSSTQQAASLEESSASLEEITGMVKVTAENATEANKIAEEMRSVSQEGIKTSDELTASMDEILHSNEEIEKLVKVINEIGEKTSVIDEIVFQTKLLSFNASVEAERAGEHGRGFAVVAQEVGSLAEMSGKAAAEIAVIVSNSIKEAKGIAGSNKEKVTRGSQLAHNAAGLFKDTDRCSSDVLGKTSDISNAAKEQSDGINQINIAISELDKMTQNNVTDVERAADASLTLNKQVEHLKEVVENLNSFIEGSSESVQELTQTTSKISETVEKKEETPKPKSSFASLNSSINNTNPFDEIDSTDKSKEDDDNSKEDDDKSKDGGDWDTL